MAAARRLAAVAARPKVIAPYVRVSALMGREDEAFRSPDLQVRAALAAIARAGAVPYADAISNPEKYRDIDQTGRDFERVGIQRLLDLKRKGVIDGIAVLDVSRVGRTTAETLEVINIFRDGVHGAFLSDRDNITDDPQGEWLLTNLVAMAQLQSDNIALGWRSVITVRAENGRHNGKPPVGYRHRRDAQTGELTTPRAIEFDPTTSGYVLEAFERYGRLGHSATSVGAWLAEVGALSAGRTTIKATLANPFYAGKVRLFAYIGKAKRRKRVPGVEPFVTDGVHPALIDDELFELVQKRLEREARTAKRHVEPVHELGGLGKCEACSRALVHQSATATRVAYLRDANGVRNGCEGCGTPRVADLVELVRERIRAVVRFDVDDAASAELVQSRKAALAQRDALTAAVAAATKGLGDLEADFYSGSIDQARFDRVRPVLEGRLSQAQGALADLPKLDVEPSAPALVDAVRRMDEQWDKPTTTPAMRNAMLRDCGVTGVYVSAPTEAMRPGVVQSLDGRVRVTFAV